MVSQRNQCGVYIVLTPRPMGKVIRPFTKHIYYIGGKRESGLRIRIKESGQIDVDYSPGQISPDLVVPNISD